MNTQFRRHTEVGPGVTQLMSAALRVSLFQVQLLEIREIRLVVWVDVLSQVLTREESLRNHHALTLIKQDAPPSGSGAQDPVSGDWIDGRPMREALAATLPDGSTVLHLACRIPENHAA
eukprot:gene46378-44243_t